MNTYQIKDRIDHLIYQCYNYLSSFIFLFRFNTKRLLKTNSEFKNKHLGERCFILGTGPSLNNLTTTQIESLKGEVVFAVNSIYKAKVVDDLIPNYYALFDNLYWGEEKIAFLDIKNKYKSNCPVILTDYRTKSIVDTLDFKSKVLYFYCRKFPFKKIDCQIDKNMYIGQNVVSTTILAAIYMGFKEIYLLGSDYNSFATQVGEHCYDDTDELKYNVYNLGFYLKFYAITTQIHYLIALLARRNSVRIVNLTQGSLLDAYPRTDISEIL